MQAFTFKKGERAMSLERCIAFLRALSPGRAWRVEVTEERSTRSVQQCRYLNGVAYKAIMDATGYERDDISEFLCGAFFGWRLKKVPKKPGNPEGVEQVPLRTTTTDENGNRAVISTVEFMDFVAFVQRFGAKRGIYIPDPDEQWAEAEAA